MQNPQQILGISSINMHVKCCEWLGIKNISVFGLGHHGVFSIAHGPQKLNLSILGGCGLYCSHVFQ